MFGFRKENKYKKYVDSNTGTIIQHMFTSIEDYLDKYYLEIENIFNSCKESTANQNKFHNIVELRNVIYVSLVGVRANLDLAEVYNKINAEISNQLREGLTAYLQAYDAITFEKWIEYFNCALQNITLAMKHYNNQNIAEEHLPGVLCLTIFDIYKKNHPKSDGISDDNNVFLGGCMRLAKAIKYKGSMHSFIECNK